MDDVIIGNEPNLNRFWLPQFNPDGSDAAAQAYLALLARGYDALKAVDPTVRVWGGALAPRGVDRPGTGRDTHSPVAFLRDMGAAYRASGRTLPIMDGLAFHPYADSSGQSPDTPHPKSTTIGLADYDRLIQTLGAAFDGTAQAGSSLPVLYDEFGVESRIPAGKEKAYTGAEAATTQAGGRDHTGAVLRTGAAARVLPAERHRHPPVPFAGRACARELAVRRLLRRRDAEGERVGRARRPRACPRGLDRPLRRARARRHRDRVRFPTQAELRRGARLIRFTCVLDCAWELRASSSRTGGTRARLTGYAPRRGRYARLPEGAQARLGCDQVLAHASCTRSIPESRRRVGAPPSASRSGSSTRVTRRSAYDGQMSDTKPGYERIEGVQVGQYVSYRFYKIDPAWRRLPIEERDRRQGCLR